MSELKHPMQPVYTDEHGVPRFKDNAIIRFIVDNAAECVHPGAPRIDPDTGRPFHQGRLDLGKLAMMDFPQEDREQFAQLMGYSIGGYHELSYVSDESAAAASKLADELGIRRAGCRDTGCAIHSKGSTGG